MSLLQKENRWMLVWVLGPALAVPLSILTGYFFIFTLFLLVPIAQAVALGMHGKTMGAAIWMVPAPLLIPLVILILEALNLEPGTISVLVVTYLLYQGVGEYLLSRLFREPLTFYFFVASLVGTAIGVGMIFLGGKLLPDNVIEIQIGLLSLGVAIQSIVSGYAIHKFYGKQTSYFLEEA